ncbi:hypothetical protein BUALT_Bualt16G0081200 [Buddleja alternifolia]|uniref:SWIM-type domain-containing protein n=1 Tax=Buddleja alternifolia TaxID=168488 RepID=A0AAV6WA08_9LAMI|nr:hypothetical protein BUALT_Bualt16G0081200 [Buddleja alternifolia]
MATGAADFIFRCVFDGSLSMSDTNIERRPYHKNCKCALHKVKGKCSHTGSQQRNISFPKKEFRTSCSLSVSAPIISSQSSYFDTSSFRILSSDKKIAFMSNQEDPVREIFNVLQESAELKAVAT